MQERAHEVWKWGIVSMLAILGVLVSTITGLDTTSRAAAGIISVVARHASLVALVFLLLGAGVTVIIVRLAAEVRNAISRIGAYLAVFHDGAWPRDADVTRLGWHAWSRIEKAVGGAANVRELPPTRYYQFHGAPRTFTALFLFYAAVVVVLFTSIDPATTTDLTFLGVATALSVAAAVEYIERQSGRRGTAWSVRWSQLARATDAEIETWLAEASLSESRTSHVPSLPQAAPPTTRDAPDAG